MIAVLFAVPHESRDFRRALAEVRPLGLDHALEGELGGVGVIVAHVGVGKVAAAANARALLAKMRPRIVISAGYAGGLAPRLRRGEIFVAENFSAPELAATCRSQACVFGNLTSEDAAAESLEEKLQLAQLTRADAVDMETGVVAEICREQEIPLLAVRVISDAADEPIPVPLHHSFDLARQRPRPGALLLYLARHPARIAPFARFVHGLSPARRELSAFLVAWISANAR